MFVVVAPPTSTPREEVHFILEGNVNHQLKRDVAEAIHLGLSVLLDIDASRIENTIVTTVSVTVVVCTVCPRCLAYFCI